MKRLNFISVSVLLLISLFHLTAVQALEVLGEVHFSRGSVAAARADGTMRILNKGSDIYLHDNIQTSERSFAVLEFKQGQRITVRPNSSLTLAYPLPILLHRGGLKVSGKGKIKPMRVKVGNTIIKTNSAVFSVRVCEVDCAKDVKAKVKKYSSVIARITEIKGSVNAINRIKKDAVSRTLKIGSPIYRLDRITSAADSYALLVFKDKGKMTIQQKTVFDIVDYNFNDIGKDNVASYSLIKGGLRVLTGAIGKQNQAAFKVTTPVATIGIRGTGFDLSCQGDCIGGPSSQTNINSGQSDGLYAHVWQGTIFQKNESGTFELKKGMTSYIATINSQSIPLPALPKVMQNNLAPRPTASKVKVEIKTAAAPQEKSDSTSSGDEINKTTPNTTEKSENVSPGVYVTVYDGEVELVTGDKSINIGAQETGYLATETTADGAIIATADPLKLEGVVNFETQDPYPTPNNFDANQADIGAFSLLSDPSKVNAGTVDVGFSCVTQ